MEEDEKGMDSLQIGLQARMISKALRKLTPHMMRNNCCVIFINQIREKVGVMYGNPETTSGGRALKFYSSIRLEVRKGEPLTGEKSEVIGHKLKYKVTKNKVARPYKQGEVDLLYGIGIDIIGEVVTVGLAANIITRAGAWYYYTDDQGVEHKWNGVKAVKADLAENEDLLEEIKMKIEDLL
jgi:recombination protein RecA